MIAGTGIDLASVARMGGMIDRFGERFTRRVFTAAEREYCEGRPDRAASYTARFAAKEAVMKALGTGFGGGVRFSEIEVAKRRRGAPAIALSGGARRRAEELGIAVVHVSLSHEGEYALAQAVAEKE